MNYNRAIFYNRTTQTLQLGLQNNSIDVKSKRVTEKCLSEDSAPSPKPNTRVTSLLDLTGKLGSSSSLDQQMKSQATKCARVVKNLNEFLNFNKSRITPSEECDVVTKITNEEGITQVKDESNSPDDLTDFFPMTTSMTRELRLELESLDRQVRKKYSLNRLIVLRKFFLTQVFGPSTPNIDQIYECTTPKQENEVVESETENELPKCSPATDVFVWENPLRSLQKKDNATTPDEQADLEYDGEILEDQNGVKSVTPIRLLKRTAR